MTDHKPPLHRFTVLDLTRVRAGPTAVRQLADWGANVIKIELPPAPGKEGDALGSRYDSDFQNLQRNKRSMTLNLKSEIGPRRIHAHGKGSGCGGGELSPQRQGSPEDQLRGVPNRETRVSFMPVSPGSGRTVPTGDAPVSIRSRRGWAA